MRFTNPNLFSIGLILFFSFIIFTFLVSVGLFREIDDALLANFQRYIPRVVDTSFSVFSILGLAEVTGIFFLFVLLFFSGVKRIYIFAAFIIFILIELFLKSYIPQIPPAHELVRTNIHIGVPSGEIAGEHFAYPSGHSGRTAFIAVILGFIVWFSPRIKMQTKKILIGLIILFTSIMFVSRIYLAEHFATDVVGGALLGFSLAFLGIYFYQNPIRIKKK